MLVYFIITYSAIMIFAIVVGWYLSQPGHTWSTLKDDVLSVFPVKYKSPVQPAQHTYSPICNDIHAHQVADAFDAALEHRAVTPPIAEQQSEAEPAEAVHDEP